MEINSRTLRDDPVVLQVVMSVREAQEFVAARVNAYDFFVSAQRHGLARRDRLLPRTTCSTIRT